jgi:hypothetical protein
VVVAAVLVLAPAAEEAVVAAEEAVEEAVEAVEAVAVAVLALVSDPQRLDKPSHRKAMRR